MGYGNEGMPWHPRKSAKAASMVWRSADYGSLTVLFILMAVTALRRWITGVRNGDHS